MANEQGKARPAGLTHAQRRQSALAVLRFPGNGRPAGLPPRMHRGQPQAVPSLAGAHPWH